MRFPLNLKHMPREWLPGLWLLAIFSAGFAPSVPAHAEVTSAAFARTLVEAVQGGELTQTGLPDLDDKRRVYIIQFTSRVGDFQASGHFRIASPNVYVLPKAEQRWQTLPPDNTTGANLFFRKGPDLATLRYNEVQATAHTKDWVFTASMRRPPSESEQEARRVILSHFGRLMQAAKHAQLLPAVATEVAYSGVKAPAILEWKKMWDDFSPQECAYTGATGPFDFLPWASPTTDKYPWLRGYRSGAPEAHLKITCATAVTPQRTSDGLIDHSRREFMGLFVYASEEEAQDNFRQMIADRQWVWQWAPLRDAFEKDRELRSSISEELGSTAASGAGVQTVWKISPPTPVSEFWTANRRGKLRMGLTEEPFRSTAGSVEIGIERHKTVVMVTGAWAYALSQPRLEKTAITIPDDLVRFSYTNERHSRARQIVDERVRILRVAMQDSKPDTPEIDWPFDQPLSIRTLVEEWQQDMATGQWQWAPPPPRSPVTINLRLYPYATKNPVSDCHLDIIDAYGEYRPIRIDAPYRGGGWLGDLYKPDSNGMVEISLTKGVQYGEKLESQGIPHLIDFERLSKLISDTRRRCSTSARQDLGGLVGATIRVAASRVNKNWETIDFAEDIEQIVISHIAEVVDYGYPRLNYKSKLQIVSDAGKNITTLPALPPTRCYKLLPDDLVTLGQFDWVRIAFPLIGQVWHIETNHKELKPDEVLVAHINPTADGGWYEKFRSKAPTIAGTGAGILFSIGAATAAVTSIFTLPVAPAFLYIVLSNTAAGIGGTAIGEYLETKKKIVEWHLVSDGYPKECSGAVNVK